MPGVTENTNVPNGLIIGGVSRSLFQVWSDSATSRHLARSPPQGINAEMRSPLYPTLNYRPPADVRPRMPLRTHIPWAERGWVPNIDEPEPELAAYFTQPRQLILSTWRDTVANISPRTVPARYFGYNQTAGEPARVGSERHLHPVAITHVPPRVSLRSRDSFGSVISTSVGPRPWSERGYYLSGEESGESDESESDSDVSEDDPAPEAMPSNALANRLGLRNANRLARLEVARRAAVVAVQRVLFGLPPTVPTSPSESRMPGSIPTHVPHLEDVFGPNLVLRQPGYGAALTQPRGALPVESEGIEMLAMEAIEHVYCTVNAWFRTNDSVPNHSGLQRDYTHVMVEVIHQGSQFCAKAVAGSIQIQGIFWLAWILEGGEKYLPLIELIGDQQCLPPIIDELAELMGGYE